MELAFASNELRSVCEDEILAFEQYHSQVAIVLMERLADLSAANKLSGLPFDPIKIDTELLGYNLGLGFTLIFKQNHVKVKQKSRQLGDTTRVKIMSILGESS